MKEGAIQIIKDWRYVDRGENYDTLMGNEKHYDTPHQHTLDEQMHAYRQAHAYKQVRKC